MLVNRRAGACLVAPKSTPSKPHALTHALIVEIAGNPVLKANRCGLQHQDPPRLLDHTRRTGAGGRGVHIGVRPAASGSDALPSRLETSGLSPGTGPAFAVRAMIAVHRQHTRSAGRSLE